MQPKFNQFLRTVALAATVVLSLESSFAATYQWTGGTSSDWSTASNWPAASGITVGPPPASGGHRVNIKNGANFEAVYDSSLGTRTYGGSNIKGLVIGNPGNATMRITGGKFVTQGTTTTADLNAGADVVGNTNGVASLIIDGGEYQSGVLGLTLGLGGGPTSSLTINNGGLATITTLNHNATTATTTLNSGGTLAANKITGSGGIKNFNFNGGTLKARQNETAFLSGLSAVNVNSNAIIDTNGFNVTIANVLRDGGSGGGLTKNGGGTLTLTGSGAALYTGPTVVNGGKLAISPAGSIAFNSNISGTFDLDLGGTGSVELGGTSNYVGNTNLLSGTLILSGSLTSNVTAANNTNLGGEGSTTGSLDLQGISTIFFNPGTTGANQHLRAATIDATGAAVSFVPTGTFTGGTGIVVLEAAGGITGTIGTDFLGSSRISLSYNVGNTQLLADFNPATLVWKGSDGLNPTFWDTETTSNWFNTGESAAGVFVAGDAVVFNDDHSLSSPVTVQIQSVVLPGSVTFANTLNAYQISGAAIGGAGSVAKSGDGILYLDSANTYSGTTTITAGTVVLGNAAALGSNAGETIVSGTGTLDIFGKNLGTEIITISGTGDGNGALVSSGAEQINAIGRLKLGGNASIGGSGRWDVRNSTPTLDMGGHTLTKVGTNYIALVGTTVTNPGNIVIEGGSFGAQLNTALDGGDTHTLTISGGAAFGNYQTTGAQNWTMVMQDGATFHAENGTGTQNTWSGPVQVADGGTATFKAQGAMTISGIISGLGSNVSKIEGNNLTLSNANTYSGATTVNGGILLVQNASALGSPSTGTTVTTGHVGIDSGVTVSGEAITINGIGTNYFGGLQGNAGICEWQGNVTIGSVGTRVGTYAGEFTVSGIIDSAGQPHGITLRPNNAGVATLIISGANTYLGDTGIVSGTNVVKLAGGDDRLPTTTSLLFGISGVSGILDLNGRNQTVAGLSTISGTANEIRSASPAVLSVNNTAPAMFSGTLTGLAGLAKSGSAPLALRGANTTAGNITVNAGGPLELPFAVTASTQNGGVITLTNASNVIVVDSTAGLVVGQAVTAAGGTGAMPGNAVIMSIVDGTSFTINYPVTVEGTPASITFGAQTAGKITFHPTINGVSNKLTGPGTAELKGTFEINLAGASIANGNQWTLVDVATANYDATTFSVAGFSELVEGVWTKDDGGKTWTFTQADGKLALAVSGYAQWATTYNVLLGENGDDDKDGISNLVEYALGLNPQASSPSPGTLVGKLLTFTKGTEAKEAGDVTYVIETSTTLAADSWTPAAATDTTDDISYLLPTDPGGKLFARLKITKP